MNNICVDIEGLSAQSNAVIVTIAAVKFNFINDDMEKFVVNLNPYEGKKLGMHISKDTLDWWRAQKPQAVAAWQHSQLTLKDALEQFKTFCGDSSETLFYSQGINYDFPVLETSFRAIGEDSPCIYYNLRDMRTAYWLAEFNTRNSPRIGEYHNALDDCLTQICWLKTALGAKTNIQ